MSVSFLKNFLGVAGTRTAEALTSTLVRHAPEAATQAELQTMEDDLDNAGRIIARLNSELSVEQKQADAIQAQYSEMMAAAELLQTRIDDPQNEAKKESLTKSLSTLVQKIEDMIPDLDREKEDVRVAQALLREAEEAYELKASNLTTAKSNLDRAKHDMTRAELEEERARQRADQAKQVAGLKTGAGSGLSTALDAMQRSAQESRERAVADNMKAKALTSAKHAGEDENIASALAAVKGNSTSNKPLSERLANLKR